MTLPFGLSLLCTEVSDAGLKDLARQKQLVYLDISTGVILGDSKVSDVGLKELGGLKQLQGLMLGGTLVTDAGVKETWPVSNSCDSWTSAIPK